MAGAGSGRTIVLGCDGMDAALTRALITAGLLPHMSALAGGAGVGEVLSTTPAESGVAWTCFNAGANPAQTGIFDFVMPASGGYRPTLAGTTESMEEAAPSRGSRKALTAGLGVVGAALGVAATSRMTRRGWMRAAGGTAMAAAAAGGVGVPFFRWWPKERRCLACTVDGAPWWNSLAQMGHRSKALRIPLAFPAQAHESVKLLAGLGVPDMQGTNGTYLLLTDASSVSLGAVNPAQIIALKWSQGRCDAKLPGPPNPLRDHRPDQTSIQLHLDGPQTLTIRSDRGSITMQRGEWSDWLPVEFHASPLVQQHGIVRFHWLARTDRMELYVTPIEFDPSTPPMGSRICSPCCYACDINDRVGRFRTIGWDTQTWGYVDGILDQDAYLADVFEALESNESTLLSQLHEADWDNLMMVIGATDQASHLFFDERIVQMAAGGRIDAGHPLVQIYRRVDRLIGRVAAFARLGGCRLVVLSDHGFAPYRRSVNLNTWLARHGWLALRDQGQWDSDSASCVLEQRMWGNVDWFNSRAYAMGFGGIYLNLAGRERDGIVKNAGEYQFLQDRLIGQLKAWRDPSDGRPIVTEAYRAQDIYRGPHLHRAPDVVVGLQTGYRVSPTSAVGGIPQNVISDNHSRWCADHCGVDARHIPGICLTNFNAPWPQQVAIGSLSRRIWPQLLECV